MLRLMASPKVRMINVRLKPETHDDFKIACELSGGSMSSILHQFIVRTIREEKEMAPRAFAKEEPKIAPKGIPVAAKSRTAGIPLMNHKELKRRQDVPKDKKKRVA
jgi:hypothetical protein